MYRILLPYTASLWWCTLYSLCCRWFLRPADWHYLSSLSQESHLSRVRTYIVNHVHVHVYTTQSMLCLPVIFSILYCTHIHVHVHTLVLTCTCTRTLYMLFSDTKYANVDVHTHTHTHTHTHRYTYSLTSGVMCLDIHPDQPFVLVIGLYDGTVAVYDLREGENNPIYKSTARTGKHTDPVWQVECSR